MKSEKWTRYCGDDERIPKEIEVWINGETAQKFEFDSKRFIDKYSKFYFIEYKSNQVGKQTEDRCEEPKGLYKSREWIEDDIAKLLKKGQWSDEDIFNIVAWKTGAISHQASSESFVYTKGTDIEKFVIQPPGARRIEMEAILETIRNCREEYVNNEKEPNDIWKKLIKCGENVAGIGTVYLVTLFSFITGGEYPIYDRFAMAALVALQMNACGTAVPMSLESKNKIKKTIITGCELPGKNSKYARTLIEDKKSKYSQYIELLSFFGEDWKSNRKIDQALWVYGHYFNVK